LSECEGLRNELEGKIQASVASPEALLSIVSSSVAAPRELPVALQDKLQTIAARHGGEVPLHGRLFAQWMHCAFPNECPYPHPVEEGDASFTPSQLAERKAMASAEEKQRHVEAASGRTAAKPTSEPVLPQWTDDEVLPLHVHPRREVGIRGLLSGAMRAVVQTAMLCVALKLACAAWAQGPAGSMAEKKCTQLPMHVKHF